MNVWHDIQQEDITSGTFWVYITMQKGSNKKYKFDVNTGCLRLEEMLYSASCHPVNGGIIPKTLNRLKEPLEALVICQEPFDLYTLVECSPVGIIQIMKNGRIEEKIIALPIVGNMVGIGFVDSKAALEAVYEEIQYFYNTCNGTEEAESWTNGEISGIRAVDMIDMAMKNYKNQYME